MPKMRSDGYGRSRMPEPILRTNYVEATRFSLGFWPVAALAEAHGADVGAPVNASGVSVRDMTPYSVLQFGGKNDHSSNTSVQGRSSRGGQLVKLYLADGGEPLVNASAKSA